MVSDRSLVIQNFYLGNIYIRITKNTLLPYYSTNIEILKYNRIAKTFSPGGWISWRHTEKLDLWNVGWSHFFLIEYNTRETHRLSNWSSSQDLSDDKFGHDFSNDWLYAVENRHHCKCHKPQDEACDADFEAVERELRALHSLVQQYGREMSSTTMSLPKL